MFEANKFHLYIAGIQDELTIDVRMDDFTKISGAIKRQVAHAQDKSFLKKSTKFSKNSD